MADYKLTTKAGEEIPLERHDVEVFAAIQRHMPGSWCVRIQAEAKTTRTAVLGMFKE